MPAEEDPPRAGESSLRLRPARTADAPALAELWSYAFPGERSVETRLRDLHEGGTYGGIETAWVCEAGSALAGALRMYDFELHLYGRAFPTMGLAAVAVEPGFRRRGVGGWMCAEALRVARRNGAALSVLYPYRSVFYRRLGYTLAGELHRYRFPPGDLPLFKERRAVARGGGAETLEEMAAVYARVADRSNGLLRRTPRMWRFLTRSGTSCVLFRDEKAVTRGYAVIRVRQRDPVGSSGRPTMRVRELVAEEPGAYRGLLGWISAQRDQWGDVVYDALPGEGFHRLLDHPRSPGTRTVRGLWFESARLLRGPMVRIVDLGQLLGAGGGGSSGTVLAVRDEQVSENQGLWSGAQGRARRTAEEPGEGALPVGIVTDLLLAGSLPGGPRPPEGWEAALGLGDFRILDAF